MVIVVFKAVSGETTVTILSFSCFYAYLSEMLHFSRLNICSFFVLLYFSCVCSYNFSEFGFVLHSRFYDDLQKMCYIVFWTSPDLISKIVQKLTCRDFDFFSSLLMNFHDSYAALSSGDIVIDAHCFYAFH